MIYTVSDLDDLLAARQKAWADYIRVQTGYTSLLGSYRRNVRRIDRELRRAQKQLEQAGML